MSDMPDLNITDGELGEDPVFGLVVSAHNQNSNQSLGNITVSMRTDFKATQECTPTVPNAALGHY